MANPRYHHDSVEYAHGQKTIQYLWGCKLVDRVCAALNQIWWPGGHARTNGSGFPSGQYNARIHDVRQLSPSFGANGQCLSSVQMKGERVCIFFRNEAARRYDGSKNGVYPIVA